jgi:hypothetical protein
VEKTPKSVYVSLLVVGRGHIMACFSAVDIRHESFLNRNTFFSHLSRRAEVYHSI